jgi:hypothetical protein
MKITGTFVIVKGGLYSVQFSGQKKMEFDRLFELWNDPIYLDSFFAEHIADLQQEYWQGMNIGEAIKKTIRDATELERKIKYLAEQGRLSKFENLSDLFKPLFNKPTKLEEFEKSKAKGLLHKSWLRVYAIRLKPNLYLVSGGAIKLTEDMNHSAHLLLELEKLKITHKYLTGEDESALDFMELF